MAGPGPLRQPLQAEAGDDGTPVPRQPRRRTWTWVAVAVAVATLLILHLTGIVGPGLRR